MRGERRRDRRRKIQFQMSRSTFFLCVFVVEFRSHCWSSPGFRCLSVRAMFSFEEGGNMSSDTLTVTDNRTGKQYEIPIEDGVIRSMDLRKIKVSDEDFGLMTYDPAFMNTASCKSSITFIDGDKGILEYRGYPIDQLAEKSSYLEVAYLLLHGELP